MLMSAKTPGFNVAQVDSQMTMHRRPQLAVHPPLLVNIGIRASVTDNNGDNFQSLLFGPEGAMFLSTDSSSDIQLSQPVVQGQGSPTLLPVVAASPSLVSQLQSLSSIVNADAITQPSAIPLLITSASSTIIPPATTSSPQASTDFSSTSQVEMLSQSQTQAGFVSSMLPSATSAGFTSATTQSTLTSAIPSFTTSQTLPSPSSTSGLQRDFASLPRVAEIVIGVVGAISFIAFFATLGSWIYKQRYRKREHAEIISITSFGDSPRRGFFGRLKKRSGKHTDDMSELGFGLGRVTFFNEPNSGDELHHVGLAHSVEDVVLDDADEMNKTDDTFTAPPSPFADHLGDGIVRRGPSIVRRSQNDEATDTASSISIFPYQHLASANALGGASATPLTVANLVPGDTSGDEGGMHRTPLLAPSSVTRYSSVGTPRIGTSNPRFMSLVEDEALAVPWAPLDIHRRSELRSLNENKASSDLRDEEEALEGKTGFRQLQLSRTETLTLAVSKTFSQRLGHSLSKTSNWHNVVTRPPPGSFQATRERDSADNTITTNGTDKHWATTLKNNFYNAINAVGSSIHASSARSGDIDPEVPPINSTRSIPDLNVVPYTGKIKGGKDLLEDILTPLPAKVASVRLERTKGSIIRGHLGIAPGGGPPDYATGLGLGLDSLSRSSTLSTCWSDNDKEPEETVRKVRMRVRGLSRDSRPVQRSDTSRTVSSLIRPTPRDFLTSGRGQVRSNGKHMKPPGKRPRISRVPVSQSSMWSSTSYASTDGGEQRQ